MKNPILFVPGGAFIQHVTQFKNVTPKTDRRPAPGVMFADDYPREKWAYKINYRTVVGVIDGTMDSEYAILPLWSPWAPWIHDPVLFRTKSQAEYRVKRLQKSPVLGDPKSYQFQVTEYYLAQTWAEYVTTRRRVRATKRESLQEHAESSARYVHEHTCHCGHLRTDHGEFVRTCRTCNCSRYRRTRSEFDPSTIKAPDPLPVSLPLVIQPEEAEERKLLSKMANKNLVGFMHPETVKAIVADPNYKGLLSATEAEMSW